MWIVVVEPYFDGSHRAWAEGYARHSRHEVTLLTHPGAFWKWRMHGASLTLADQLDLATRERGRAPDLVIASDMVDLAAFAGFARGSLGGAPLVAFFHENQLTYPLAPGALPDLTYAMKNWTTMAVADEVWFNSNYHLVEMSRALPVLLGSFPDQRHVDRLFGVLGRCRVMGVGIHTDTTERTRVGARPVVLWNQRWEHDKDPARFFSAVDRAVERGADFDLAIAGQNFRNQPSEFEAARQRHANRIVHYGEADSVTYQGLLSAADVVVSTARHEFFGIAVAEAVAAGCLPVLPDDLAYPELVGEHSDWCLYGDDAELDGLLEDRLADVRAGRASERGGTLRQSVIDRFAWPSVAERYDDRCEELVERFRLSC